MANRHYGNIGDVWKHLALTQILHAEQPARFWESHAGNAVYPLEPDPARDFGIVHFMQAGAQVPILNESLYYRLTSSFFQNETPVYPGSPALALAMLREADADFLFCDTDADSIMNISMLAPKLETARERLRLVHGDGIAALKAMAGNMRDVDLTETVAFIDPYEPLSTENEELSPLQLFSLLTLLGVQTVLWYGYGSEGDQRDWHGAVAQELKTQQLDPLTHNLWIGEIRLIRVQGFYDDFHPGVLGCGLLCANLSEGALMQCTQLGKALESIYKGVILPDDQPGDLHFTHAAFGQT